MTFSHILTGRHHYAGIVTIGQCVNDLNRRIRKYQAIPLVVQPVADAAISYENDIASEIWEVIVEPVSSSDHGEAPGRKLQAWDVIDPMVIRNPPTR